MAIQKQNIEIIGGSQPNILFNLTINGQPTSKSSAYTVTFSIARQGNPNKVYSTDAEYDSTDNCFIAILPSEETIKWVGNYIYHVRVRSANVVAINWYGNFNVIRGINNG